MGYKTEAQFTEMGKRTNQSKTQPNKMGHLRDAFCLCFQSSLKFFVNLYHKLICKTINIQMKHIFFMTGLQKHSSPRHETARKRPIKKKTETVSTDCTPLLLFYINLNKECLFSYGKRTDTTEVYYNQLRVFST